MTSTLANRVSDADAAQQAGQDVTPRTQTVFDKIRTTRAMYEGLLRNIEPARFVRLASAAARTVAGKCTDDSILGCLMLAAQLDLEPGTPLGHAHLVPFGNDCTFIVGYQGYIELARRAGYSVRADAVFEGDEFEWELGLTPTLRHKPIALNRTDYSALTHVYAISQSRAHPEEPQTFVVMTKDQVEAIRKRARSQSGPWKTDPVQMAIKTPVRRLSKWMPMSIEMAAAAAMDEATPRQTVANLDELDPDTIDVDAVEPAQIPPPGQSDQEPSPPTSDGTPGPAEGPAADPMAQEHVDAMGEAAQRSTRALVMELLPDVKTSPEWPKFLRKTGLSSNPERWSDAQFEQVWEFIQEPREGSDG